MDLFSSRGMKYIMCHFRHEIERDKWSFKNKNETGYDVDRATKNPKCFEIEQIYIR